MIHVHTYNIYSKVDQSFVDVYSFENSDLSTESRMDVNLLFINVLNAIQVVLKT